DEEGQMAGWDGLDCPRTRRRRELSESVGRSRWIAFDSGAAAARARGPRSSNNWQASAVMGPKVARATRVGAARSICAWIGARQGKDVGRAVPLGRVSRKRR